MFVNDLYMDARAKLLSLGIQSAALEARELCCKACGRPREDFAEIRSLYASERTKEALAILLSRRTSGEPLAYILGEWDFYGMTFYLNAGTLIPRADTETLCESAIFILRSYAEPRVLDLCCGSGCIGIAIAKHCPGARLTLADLSPLALEATRKNMLHHKLSGRCAALIADAKKSPEALGKFDMIVCNPPYITAEELIALDSSVLDYEPKTALLGGEDGLDFYRSVARLWRGAINPGGYLLFECGKGQHSDVSTILSENGYFDIRVIPDLNGIMRVVCAKKI